MCHQLVSRKLMISVVLCYTTLVGLSNCANVKRSGELVHYRDGNANKTLNTRETQANFDLTSGLLPELSDWLIAPNTKWCGRGTSAGKYNSLGGASQADKCCRKHDHCKLNIQGLQRRWDLFNYRPYTLSHCSCDMRFRMCLKMSNSPDSNMVGKLFFNFVQTQCFVLKAERVCERRSPITGDCEKTVVKRKAYLKNNKKF